MLYLTPAAIPACATLSNKNFNAVFELLTKESQTLLIEEVKKRCFEKLSNMQLSIVHEWAFEALKESTTKQEIDAIHESFTADRDSAYTIFYLLTGRLDPNTAAKVDCNCHNSINQNAIEIAGNILQRRGQYEEACKMYRELTGVVVRSRFYKSILEEVWQKQGPSATKAMIRSIDLKREANLYLKGTKLPLNWQRIERWMRFSGPKLSPEVKSLIANYLFEDGEMSSEDLCNFISS